MNALKKMAGKVPVVGPALRSAYSWLLWRSPIARSKWLGQRRMMDRANLHSFWQTPMPDGNIPKQYIAPEVMERSQALLEMISNHSKDARILEVGCNAGRNVAYLFNAGYKNIEAIEISPHAVDLLRETFPELEHVPIHLGAAEDALLQFPEGHFDLVFTMAVLEHIHPDSVEVFDNIARVAKTILTIEPTTFHTSTRQFPHNIPREFGRRGFRLESKVAMGDLSALRSYSAYSFVRI